MKTQVHKIEIAVIDRDEMDLQGVISYLRDRNQFYAISILSGETREIDWSDEHPVNYKETREKFMRELFSEPQVTLGQAHEEYISTLDQSVDFD